MSEQPQSPSPRPPTAPRASRGERLVAALLAGACLGVLVIAAWLHADSSGHGTHTQLGLSECAWAEYFDAPCATCGMTTSFAYAADGRWMTSISAQPFGTALALTSAVLFWGGLHVSATGSRLGSAVAPVLTGRLLTVAVAVFLAAWAYKWVIW